MALDLAFDFVKKDLVISPGRDIEIVSGQASVDQRIRVRLLAIQGEWELDPSNGRLGSHLGDAFRMPLARALQTVPMLVKEALAPMPDIEVDDVECSLNPDSTSAIDILILYRMVDQGSDAETLSTNITVTG